MAKMLSTALKAVAGAAAGAGLFALGRVSGKGQAARQAESSGAPKDVRPGSQPDRKAKPQASSSGDDYHALIHKCSDELLMRLAEQAHANTASADASREAHAIGAPSDKAPAAQRTEDGEQNVTISSDKEGLNALTDTSLPGDADTTPDSNAELEPYQIIQEALSTSTLFTGEDDQVYKPTPFKMP